MDQLLVAEILTSDSDEIADLKANITILDNLVDLARQIDALPNISKRFYEDSRSLYQSTCSGQDIASLENMLSKFFGPPVKPVGKLLPRKLRKNSSIKYLGGIQKDQSLFLLQLKTGEFYGALWPWQRNKEKIEIHLGYCSDWITDEDYEQIETLVKRSLSRSAYERMDTGVGGQIHGISLPSFLQMAEMERSTLTLRIGAADRMGRLYLEDGELFDAATGGLTGRQAAYKIISWENAVIQIEPADPTKINAIKQPLMHVLMESLKIKDESVEGQAARPASKTAAARRPAKRLVRLERAPAPRKPSRKLQPIILAVLLLILAALVGGTLVANHQISHRRKVAQLYEQLLSQVETTADPETKLGLLKTYLEHNPDSPQASSIQSKMLEIKDIIEDRDFDQTTLKISNLPVDEHYEKTAIALYSAFLEKYPNSRYADKINKSIAGIKTLLDQYYYEELKRAAHLDFSERTKIYRDYLARYPRGKYRKDVSILIDEMGRRYLDFLKSETTQCDQTRNWDPCLEHCNSFIEVYQGMELGKEAVALKAEMIDKRDVYQLTKDVQAAGSDYQKAYDMFHAYLAEHPQSSQKGVVEKRMRAVESKLGEQQKWILARQYAANPKNGLLERIQRLDNYLSANIAGPYAGDAQDLLERLENERQTLLQQRQQDVKRQEAEAMRQRELEKRAEQQKRIAQYSAALANQLNTSPRYKVNGDSTVTDATTGLTWSLLDTHQILGGCLTYEAALTYVSQLRQGGHSDWRLPTASELAAIYKQAPFFPPSGAAWYWTSESYVKGYHTVADIVTAAPETVFEREYRAVTECGAVRAVRP
jgi:Protein of unknown function (DUF1566)/Domain of unknown function (DUF4388)